MSHCPEKDEKPHYSREALFPGNCLAEDTPGICKPEGDRAVFLISDDALQRLLSRNEGGGPSTPKTGQRIENHEEEWRTKEHCIDKLHAEKVGIDESSIYTLEQSTKHFKASCGGEFDMENKPLLECYQANMITPLKCRCLVLDYMQRVAEYRQQILFGSRS